MFYMITVKVRQSTKAPYSFLITIWDIRRLAHAYSYIYAYVQVNVLIHTLIATKKGGGGLQIAILFSGKKRKERTHKR